MRPAVKLQPIQRSAGGAAGKVNGWTGAASGGAEGDGALGQASSMVFFAAVHLVAVTWAASRNLSNFATVSCLATVSCREISLSNFATV